MATLYSGAAPYSAADELQLQWELGDDDGQTLKSILPGLLAAYAAKSAIDPRLPFLYAKRQAVDVLMGHAWQLTDTQNEDAKTAASQKIKNLQLLRANCQSEIDQFEAQSRASMSPSVVAMGECAPLSNNLPCGVPPRLPRPWPRLTRDGDGEF